MDEVARLHLELQDIQAGRVPAPDVLSAVLHPAVVLFREGNVRPVDFLVPGHLVLEPDLLDAEVVADRHVERPDAKLADVLVAGGIVDGDSGGPVHEAPDLEADGVAVRQAVPRAEDQPVLRVRFRDLELAAGLPEEAPGIGFDFEIERPTLSAAEQDDLGGLQFLAGLRGADARHPSDARMKRHGDVAVDLRPVGRRVGFPEIFRIGVEQIDFLQVRRIERLHEVRIRHLPACPEPEEEWTGDGVELELEPCCPPAHAVFAVLA